MNEILHYFQKLIFWVLIIENNFCFPNYVQFFHEDSFIFISFHLMKNRLLHLVHYLYQDLIMAIFNFQSMVSVVLAKYFF